ncbi:MAG TPA: hypothetical protein VNX40_16155 [Mucilaginibacter sp.]|jgi:hypothetical protein|nr:hypothetical protein [Mucilaginibacter sp.]
MKSRFLFPHKWMVPGIVLFLTGIAVHFINQSTTDPAGIFQKIHPFFPGIDMQVLADDVEYLSLVIGLLLIAFSKEKIEDEQIVKLRTDSLQWAIYVNYGIFIICTIFINGMDYLGVVAYNVLTPLLFFIIRFRWKIYQLNRAVVKEEVVS